MNDVVSPLRISDPLQELILLLQRNAPSDGTHVSAMPELCFRRASHVSEPKHSVNLPSLYVIAQGSKTAALGGDHYQCNPGDYLVSPVHLPVIGMITEASTGLPYLSLQIIIHPDVILDIIRRSSAESDGKTGPGIVLGQSDAPLLDGLVRLVRLLDTPEDMEFLAPMIIREILYRVMKSDQGAFIRQFSITGSYPHSISRAIQLINRDFAKPLMIEELAKEANMSPSSLHKYFKKITAISPLQYQKALRLQTARRLLLSEGLEAADAGFRVGYESPSQFSREYVRMFGRPPMNDVKHLRNTLSTRTD